MSARDFSALHHGNRKVFDALLTGSTYFKLRIQDPLRFLTVIGCASPPYGADRLECSTIKLCINHFADPSRQKPGQAPSLQRWSLHRSDFLSGAAHLAHP